jgi:thiamine pyrophosphokinase
VNGQAANIHHLGKLLNPDDLLIAADGGLRYLRLLGLRPQILIGDLDSVSAEDAEDCINNGVQVLRHPVQKDETDLELALNFALESGCGIIVIAAALGGRLDQTLGNLFLLTREDLEQTDIRLDDGIEEVFLIRTSATIIGNPDDVISLLPYGQPAVDVKTENLRYPLDFETLLPEETRGISNVMENHHASVSISSGILICIHTRKNIPVQY